MPGYDLATLVHHAQLAPQVRKSELSPGDRVLVKTCNSVYSIRILENGWCSVSGGWFDRKGLSPMRTRISGCTWGGSAIKVDVAAACGLCLEFGNRLVTSLVRRIFVLP